MRTKAIMAGLCLAGVTVFLVVGMMRQMPAWGITTTNKASGEPGVREAYHHLPLSFEANQGQVEASVKYVSRGNGYSLFLTPVEAVLALRGGASPTSMAALRMQFVNGQATPNKLMGLETLPGKVNYFLGDDPAQWQTNVPTYAKVKYEAVYPGVDLMYYGDQQQLEFDFVVAPGADPKIIALGFQGIDHLEVDAQADLILSVTGEQIRMRKPLIYQEVSGMRREVRGGYVLLSPPAGSDALPQVGFQVGAYDPDRPLVIDPVLVYATYLGGSGGDSSFDIAVDASGDAYVTGSTGSTDFPTSHPLSSTLSGDFDAFVTKLAFDPATSVLTLTYATYLGGSASDFGKSIAVDASGNAYVAGSTDSTNFPIISSVQSANGGLNDAFAAKLAFDPATSELSLAYATYLGGSGNDFGEDIAVDASGNAYVAGSTGSTDFPTAHPLQLTLGGNFDAFVAKLAFDSSLTLAYSTYLGGSASESGVGIALNASGDAYVIGTTASTDFPTASPVQPAIGGAGDVFLTRLAFSPAATPPLTFAYSTYLGGSGNDFGEGVAVDASGSAYATGSTASMNFPTAHALQPASGGMSDAFVTKLAFDPAATPPLALAYSTYLGGGSTDTGKDIAADASGNAYVIGSTFSTNFPTMVPLQSANSGSSDAFVARLAFDPAATPSLTLTYSTYLGGSSTDDGEGIAVDAFGDAYVTGSTFSSDFPTANPWQSALVGSFDAIVAKISQPPTADAGGPYTAQEGDSVLVAASGDNSGGDALTFTWDLDGDGIFETPGQSATFSAAGLDGPSDHSIRLRATDSSGLSAEAVTTVAVLNVAPTVEAIAAPIDPVTVNADIATSANFTDPGLPDTHTAVWNWDDGSASAGAVHEANGSGSVGGNHAYASPGLYTVRVTVTDDDGGAGESVFRSMAVYDPGAGFATGGGWIESPAGAYTPDPSLTGKLTFGFVTKYLNGAATPAGQATFKFHAAGLDFSSASYEWLVVVGSKALVKGSGAINGSGDYGFRLTVADGDVSGGGEVDKFRLKIWDKATGVILYDNQMGAPDEADATQAIAGGNVTLHD